MLSAQGLQDLVLFPVSLVLAVASHMVTEHGFSSEHSMQLRLFFSASLLSSLQTRFG